MVADRDGSTMWIDESVRPVCRGNDEAKVNRPLFIVGLNVDPALLVRGGRLTEAQARDVRHGVEGALPHPCIAERVD